MRCAVIGNIELQMIDSDMELTKETYLHHKEKHARNSKLPTGNSHRQNCKGKTREWINTCVYVVKHYRDSYQDMYRHVDRIKWNDGRDVSTVNEK